MPGVILIKSGIIDDILPLSSFSASLYPSFIIEDFGSKCISPGLIDLNVSIKQDPASVIKQASTGGVTTIVTSDPLPSKLPQATNLLHLDESLSSSSDSIGYKLNLNSLPPNLAQILNSTKPVFIHPELKTHSINPPIRSADLGQIKFERFPFVIAESSVKASKFRLDSDDEAGKTDEDEASPKDLPKNEASSESESCESDIDGIDDIVEPLIVITSCQSEGLATDHKKRGSVPMIVNQELAQLKLVNSPRHYSIQVSNLQQRVPVQDLPFIAKGINVQMAYSEYLGSYSADWEGAAIKKVFSLRPACPIHFSNLSSFCSVKLIQEFKIKTGLQVTCETSTPFIYFSETDVKPGDSRYKTAPPIRDHENYLQLWNLIKSGNVDCISSYHQPVAPPEKFIGDFFKAKCGMISIGFTLQAAWTRLRSQIAIEEEGLFLVLLAKMLSERPAKVLGIEDRGSIAKGKKADLVVWDPDSKFKVWTTFDKYPEMSPMLGEELYGVVHKTYSSGIMTYSIDN